MCAENLFNPIKEALVQEIPLFVRTTINRLSKNMFPLTVESAHWTVASALRCANLRSQVVFVLILSPDRCPLLMFGLHSSLVYILQSTNRSTEIPIKTKVVDPTVSQKNKKEDVHLQVLKTQNSLVLWVKPVRSHPSYSNIYQRGTSRRSHKSRQTRVKPNNQWLFS